MHSIIRKLIFLAVMVTVLASSAGQYSADASDTSPASDSSRKWRYRVVDVADQTKPGIEWQLDPPLSPNHDAVQVLFWAGTGQIKICKGGNGRYISSSKSFLTPRPLQGAVFELRAEHVDGDTILTLAFPQNGTFEPVAMLRIPGIHTLSGPTDEYLCTIESIP